MYIVDQVFEQFLHLMIIACKDLQGWALLRIFATLSLQNTSLVQKDFLKICIFNENITKMLA